MNEFEKTSKIEGRNPVLEALKSGRQIDKIYIKKDRPKTILKVIVKSNNYSFTPPRATPAMMYFDNAKYTMKIGNTVRHRPR